MKVLTTLDFAKAGKVINGIFDPRASDDTGLVAAQLWFNTTSLRFKGHDGANTFTIPRLDGADTVTGIWNFNPSSGTVPFTVDGAMTSTVTNLNSDRVDGYHAAEAATVSTLAARDSSGNVTVATPTSDGHAATKAYVDATSAGQDWKDSCRVATTTNITLSGTQTIDGIAVVADDRVLVKDQTDASENGIYVCAAGAWSRSSDADANAEVTSGLTTFIEEGTANAGAGFTITTTGAIVVDTDDIVFTKTSGGSVYTAGNGIVKSGTTFHAFQSASYTVGAMPYATAADTIGMLSAVASGKVLKSNGLNTAPLWAQLDLTSDVTGILPIANGGTGTSTQATQGAVFFAGGSGVLASDAAELLWDNSTKRLHVGGNSPDELLHVSGNTLVEDGSLTVENNSSGAVFSLVRTGTQQWDIYASSTILYIEPQTAEGDVKFRDYGNTETLVLDNSLNAVHIPNGSLSVGVFDSAWALNVRQSSNSSLARFYWADGTYNPRMEITQSSTGTDINHTYSSDASALTFSIATVEQLKITGAGITMATLPTSSDNSDNVVVSDGGLLKQRSLNSGAWDTRTANRIVLTDSSGGFDTDGFATWSDTYKTFCFGGTASENARLKVLTVENDVTANESNYVKAVYAQAVGGYNISAGITDSGYRIALDASVFVYDSDFEGTIAKQYAVWARHGANLSSAGSAITNSYGVYIDSLTNANTTITNFWGLYQNSPEANNYFAGHVYIGTTSAPSAGQLYVYEGSANSWTMIESGSTDGKAGSIFKNDAGSWTIGIDGSNSDAFAVASGSGLSSPLFVIDSNGNVGIGTTDIESIHASYNYIQFDAASITFGDSATNGTIAIGSNAYLNPAGSWVYRAAGFASVIQQDDAGGMRFRVAGSGSEDASISLVTALGIDSTGNLTANVLAASSSDSVVTENSGVLEKRTISSTAWSGSFTPKSVPFADSNGDLKEDNAGLSFEEALDVLSVGTVDIESGNDAVIRNVDSDGSLTFYGGNLNQGGGLKLYARNHPTHPHAFEILTSGTSKVLVDEFGNLGLGTTTPNEQLEITGNFRMPATTATTGIIYRDSERFIHSFQHPTGDTVAPSGNNVFIGLGAGNFTTGATATSSSEASNNVGIGRGVLDALTTGYTNSAFGSWAGSAITTGWSNTLGGYASGGQLTVGNYNAGWGHNALGALVDGTANTAIGGLAADATDSSDGIVAVGYQALTGLTSGGYTIALGYRAGMSAVGGATLLDADYGIAIGYDVRLTEGSNNEIVIGKVAEGNGSNTTTIGGSNNLATYFPYGNVGIGTTDIEAWHSSYCAIEFHESAIISNLSTPDIFYCHNTYYDGAWKYKATDTAAYYSQVNGQHIWKVAASGTIDTAITWTTAMEIQNDGELQLNAIQSGTSNNVLIDAGSGVVRNRTIHIGAWTGDADTLDGQEGAWYQDLANSTGDTDDISEGVTNLFYTDARARGSLSSAGATEIDYNSSTGVIGLGTEAARIKSGTIGGTTSPTFTHNLNTYNVKVEVFRTASPRDTIIVDVSRNTVNQITVGPFPTAPSSGEYTVIVSAANG